jgi:hypothetical protein
MKNTPHVPLTLVFLFSFFWRKTVKGKELAFFDLSKLLCFFSVARLSLKT